MLEIMLNQQSLKATSVRESTQILDFLGDIGGFKEALLLILAFIGEYFSAKFFIQTVGSEMYLEKKASRPDLEDSGEMEGGQQDHTNKKLFQEDLEEQPQIISEYDYNKG
jgi:hypothetical protein